MAIFASRRVNVDPEPWVHPLKSGYRRAGRLPGWKFDPRPEFDNVVNPILVEFRYMYESRGFEAIGYYLRWIEMDGWEPGHIDHARKVLRKLAAFRGGSE
jgi:hypothetical protein